jgi:DNA-binding CsgD family transcriptional regulator
VPDGAGTTCAPGTLGGVEEWPLIGRVGELRRLRELVLDVACPGVVLAAAAGVGKTRLARECLAIAEGAGLATVPVTASRSAAGLPFGAVAPLLPPVDQTNGTAAADRSDLLRRSAEALVARAGSRRLAVTVDNAHLLDDASATLIHQLAATNAAFVLATVRAGEPAPDPVVALWRDGLVERIELGGLQAEAVEELLSAALGGPVDRAAVSLLAARSQGNVLFLRELVLGGLDDGTLRDDGGIWRLEGPLAPSDRLVELVEARLGTLEAAERDLLELVSFGEPVGSAELGALGDPALAEGLERKGLLASAMNGRRLEVRLAHPLYGEVLRTRIPALRVHRIARSLADVVEGTGARRREDTLRVATWRLTGGGARPGLMLAAASSARWHYEFPLAERLARAAVAAGAGFEASLLAAQLAWRQGRTAQASAELAVLATEAGDDEQRALVATARIGDCLYRLRYEEALRIAEDAEAKIADPAWRDETSAMRAGVMLLADGPRAAAEVTEPILQRAEGRALVWACMSGARSLGRLGRLDAALEACSRGYDAQLTVKVPMDWYPWIHLDARCELLALSGRFLESEVLATEQYDQSLADGSPEAQAQFALRLAKSVGEQGRVQQGARYTQEAVALFRQLGRPLNVRDALATLALAASLGGRPGVAAEALAAIDDLDGPSSIYNAVDLRRAKAWTAAASGDLPQASLALDEAATLGEDIGDLFGAAAALHDLARLGHAKDIAERLHAVVDHLEGDLAPARLAHVESLTRDDPNGLHQASLAFESMGANLLAAEAAADAAVAWRHAGDPRQAAAAERHAATLADRCEGATTPALHAIQTRARLTPAEREAAMLAAAGRSNKQIANELNLSVRTIETRLQHVYEKLGIGGREELANALHTAS